MNPFHLVAEYYLLGKPNLSWSRSICLWRVVSICMRSILGVETDSFRERADLSYRKSEFSIARHEFILLDRIPLCWVEFLCGWAVLLSAWQLP
jgi:hypothetical protein